MMPPPLPDVFFALVVVARTAAIAAAADCVEATAQPPRRKYGLLMEAARTLGIQDPATAHRAINRGREEGERKLLSLRHGPVLGARPLDTDSLLPSILNPKSP